MFEKLQELIAKGDYNEALYEFQDKLIGIEEYSDADKSRFYTLEASIWEGLFDIGAELEAIEKGLKYDSCNYELFYMLYLYYADINASKAYLCLEMALFYCPEGEDKNVIEESLKELKKRPEVRVRNVSVMILSFNDLELLMECIDSVEGTMPPGSYEIVVVDNCSTEDGVVGYLRRKMIGADYRFKLLESDENLGFPKGCNLGAVYCNPDNDILFLNNDAILMPNALFWMRMGLYDSWDVGACSGVSNSASLQTIPFECFEDILKRKLLFDYIEDTAKEDVMTGVCWHKSLGFEKALEVFKEYARYNCGYMANSLEPRFRLTGFAYLISRQALYAVAPDRMVFDEVFSPGYFEDDDLGIRISRAGFKQYLCKNALIYHNGGNGFEGHNDAMDNSRAKFENKWGFDVWGYSLPFQDAVDAVVSYYEEKKMPIRVLDFTCGFGATASSLKKASEDIEVYGVCVNGFEASIASNIADEVFYGNLNTCKLPWKDHSFDIVIAERESVSKLRGMQYLKSGGVLIGFEAGETLIDINMFGKMEKDDGTVSVLTD